MKRPSGTRRTVEQRRSSRIPVDLPARLERDGQPCGTARVTNLGEGGAFVLATGLGYGAEVTLIIEAPGGELRLPSIVRWTTQTGLGLQFLGVGVRELAAIARLTAA